MSRRDGTQRWTVQQCVFSVGVWSVGGALMVRDRLLRRVHPPHGVGLAERVTIASGPHRLDAVLVRPAAGEIQAAVLICHGIGETVEHWVRAQDLLAEGGVASLVFNYSGFGRSTGWFSVQGCERDAAAAFDWLRDRMRGTEIAVLGFSLGSGVATVVADRLPVSGLVVCEAYTSFREAVESAGAPAWICKVVPDVWRSEETLRGCAVPVLVVHGERDRLFPVAMGERLAQAAGARGFLAVVPAMGHSDLHANPHPADWECILCWLKRGRADLGIAK